MRKIYVAGPYTLGDVAVNVRTAMEWGNKLITYGYAPYVPHLSHFMHMQHPHPYSVWIALDLIWLQSCDAVLRLPGESKGADGEVERAIMLGIPVYHSLPELMNEMPVEV